MKKLFCVFLSILLCSGCNAKDSVSEKENEIEKWEANTGLQAVQLPEDAQKAFDAADITTVEGDIPQPIALLARQTVSGTNYVILCYMHDGYAEEQDQIQAVTIYQDLEDNCTVQSIVPVDLNSVVSKNRDYSKDEVQISGGFKTKAGEYTSQDDERISNDGLTGLVNKNSDHLKYEAAAVIGNGLDEEGSIKELAVLCITPVSDTEDDAHWTIITVDDPNENDPKIYSYYALDPADYVQYADED